MQEKETSQNTNAMIERLSSQIDKVFNLIEGINDKLQEMNSERLKSENQFNVRMTEMCGKMNSLDERISRQLVSHCNLDDKVVAIDGRVNAIEKHEENTNGAKTMAKVMWLMFVGFATIGLGLAGLAWAIISKSV